MLTDKRWAVIGIGNIGKLLCERLLSAGVEPDHLTVYDITPGSTDFLVREYGVKILTFNRASFQDIDVILVATPPKAVKGFLSQTVELLHPNHLIISFANAVSLKRLETLTPEGVSIIRVIPNIPSLIGEGINPVVYGRHVTVEAKQLVEELLRILGKTISVRDDQMNWLVGLTGASMRSILPVLEGLIKAGTEAGLSSEEARAVAAQVLVGTADLVLQTGLTIDDLKAMTPLLTIDEDMLANMIFNAARTAKEKMDIIQSEEEVNG